MRRFLSLLLSFAVLSSSVAFPLSRKKLNKLQAEQHKAMHEIVMVLRDADGNIVEAGLCTAYAVGPHTLMTAEHCNEPTATGVYIDPISREEIKLGHVASYTILDREFDHQDHMLLDVSGVYFKDTIYLSPNVRLPKQGEKTYSWGNPHGYRDQYREGLVTGSMPSADIGDTDVDAKGPLLYLVQTTVIGGDSGSSVFGEDGQLIGIVTYGINGGTLMGMFPIQFSGAQIEQAGK